MSTSIAAARIAAFQAEVARLWGLTAWSAAPALPGFPQRWTTADLADAVARLPATADDDVLLQDAFNRVAAYLPPGWSAAERGAALASLTNILRGLA